ncbi:MAG: disulfide bond formation protein B [Rhodobacteraceae bacterium]|nr:disulfide bond formation protein B [Paracoccaceae bacterium]
MLKRSTLILLAAGGSLALMLGALAFQYIGQMPPCTLCIWQRYPHVLAILIGALALAVSGPALPFLGALSALATAGVALFHTGVERKWWDGLQSCSAPDISALSPQELLEAINNAPIVQCDQIPWQLFGLSMANWNAVISLGLAVLWVMAARSKA